MATLKSIPRYLTWAGMAAAALACSDDSTVERRSQPEPGGLDPGPAGDPGPAPLYAMMVQVISPDMEGRTVYAVLTDGLDVSEVSLDAAREFPGVANFAAVGGRLLVSDGETPRIDSFEITEDHAWVPGETISFVGYPMADDGANFFYQTFLDDHTAYLPYDGSKRIVWDPSTMTIVKAVEGSELALTRDGLSLEVGGNRTGVSYDGPVLHPFFYRDDDWFEFAPTSPIAAYDRETHEEMTIVEAPCPGLAVATRDEAGNTYFSSWDYGPGQALYGLAPAPCTVRIGADLQLDEAWTTDHTAWTEGRFAMNFRYVGNGKAVADVLHHEEIDLDFSAAYDPAVEDAVWEGGHWRSWIFDLALGTGRPLAGLEPGGTGLQMVQIEGRTFLFAVYDSGGRTIAYELDSDGNLVERFRTPGEVFKWIRVR